MRSEGILHDTGTTLPAHLQAARDAAAAVAYPDRVGDGYVHLTIVKRGDQRPAPPKVDTAWMADAGCKGSTDIMFPTDRPGGHQRATLARYIAEAQRVCADCPVADECARWATLEQPNAGMYAGVLWHRGHPVKRHVTEIPANRLYEMRSTTVGTPRRRGRPPTEIIHGTNAGYRAHLRRGETPCDDCYAAHRQYENDAVKRRRMLKAVDVA